MFVFELFCGYQRLAIVFFVEDYVNANVLVDHSDNEKVYQ